MYFHPDVNLRIAADRRADLERRAAPFRRGRASRRAGHGRHAGSHAATVIGLPPPQGDRDPGGLDQRVA